MTSNVTTKTYKKIPAWITEEFDARFRHGDKAKMIAAAMLFISRAIPDPALFFLEGIVDRRIPDSAIPWAHYRKGLESMMADLLPSAEPEPQSSGPGSAPSRGTKAAPSETTGKPDRSGPARK